MSQAYLCYAREEHGFARMVASGLDKRGVEPRFDVAQVQVQTAEPWTALVTTAIEGAETFVFVLSPASVRSQTCVGEMELALSAGKRIVPLWRRDVAPAEVPDALARLRWIDCRDDGDLERALDAVAERGRGVQPWWSRVLRRRSRVADLRGERLDGRRIDDLKREFARGALVEIAADFSDCVFPEIVDFSSVTFERGTLFEGARFEAAAVFNAAAFRDDVSFFRTRFEGDAHFSMVRFEGVADFEAATFLHDAYFDRADFRADSRFLRVVAPRDLSFTDARFVTPSNVPASVRAAQPRRRAEFRAWFFEEVDAWLGRGGPGVLLVTGERRSAKTAMARWLRDGDAGPRFDLVYICEEDVSEPAGFERALSARGEVATLYVDGVDTAPELIGRLLRLKARLVVSARPTERILKAFEDAMRIELPASSEALERLTPAGRRAIAWARGLAERSGVRDIDAAHMLAGLFEGPRSSARRLLTIGGSVEDTNRALERLVPGHAELDEVRPVAGPGLPPLSRDAELVLVRAAERADALSSRDIRSRMVLAALLSEPESEVTRWVASWIGVPAETLVRMLAESAEELPIAEIARQSRGPSDLAGHEGAVVALAVTPDERLAVSAGTDGTVRVWDVDARRALRVNRWEIENPTAAAVTADNRAVVASTDAILGVVDTVGEAPPSYYGARAIHDVAVAADGRAVLAATPRGAIDVWDVESGHRRTLIAGKEAFHAVAVSPDGRIATGAKAQVRLWDGASGEPLGAPWDGHEGIVWSVAFTPDGRHLVSASQDSTLRVWDVESGTCLHVIEGHSGAVWAVVVLDDRRAVSAGDDGTVRIWDVLTGAELDVLRGHRTSVRALAAARGQGRVLSADVNGAIRIWQVEPAMRPPPIDRIELVQRDLLSMEVDALVNPVGIEPGTTGRVGVQIAERLGEQFREALSVMRDSVLIADAGPLPARMVVNVRVEDEPGRGTPETVAVGVGSALRAAVRQGARTVALPAIGTGAMELNPSATAPRVVEELLKALDELPELETVTIAFAGLGVRRAYEQALVAHGAEPGPASRLSPTVLTALDALAQPDGSVSTELLMGALGTRAPRGVATDLGVDWLIGEAVELVGPDGLVEPEHLVEALWDEEVAEEARCVLTLDVRPDVARVGDRIEVVAELTPVDEVPPDAVAFAAAPGAPDLTILLEAPGFEIAGGDDAATLALDSAPWDGRLPPQEARFELVPLRPGAATVTAAVHVGDALAHLLKAGVDVAELAPGAAGERRRVTVAARPVALPDLLLEVRSRRSGAAVVLDHRLRALSERVPLGEEVSARSAPLPAGWQARGRALLEAAVADAAGAPAADLERRLVAFGQHLFDELVPDALAEPLRAAIAAARTLLLVCEEDAWAPWELLHDGAGFLGTRVVVGRWPLELDAVRPYEFPVGPVSLAYYEGAERPERWAALLQPEGAPAPHVLPGGMFGELGAVEAMQGLHVVREAAADDGLADAPARVRDGAAPSELGHARLSLRRNRPLVTLALLAGTAPRTTALERTWALAFLRARCSAFAGPLWTTAPEVDGPFTAELYAQLWRGASLGGAFAAARAAARAAAPDSVDWLAYVLFGDPMARAYLPVASNGYAVVEPIGWDLDDPLPIGEPVRLRATLSRTPPVWHEERIIEASAELEFERLELHVLAGSLRVAPEPPLDLFRTADGGYLAWFTLEAPPAAAGRDALVQVTFLDGGRPVQGVMFSVQAAVREEAVL